MTTVSRNGLKAYFTTGATPTQTQFADAIDSGLNFVDDGVMVGPLGHVGIGINQGRAKLTVKAHYDAPLQGTLSIAQGSSAVVGTNTRFTAQLLDGTPLQIGTFTTRVVTILNDAHMIVSPAPGAAVTGTGVAGSPLLHLLDQQDNVLFAVDGSGNLGVGAPATDSAKVNVNGSVSATSFAGDGAALTGLDAAKLTGTLNAAQLPTGYGGGAAGAIDARHVSIGTLSTAVLPASVPFMQGTTMTVNGALAVTGNISAGGSLTAHGISIAAGGTITGDGSGLTNLNAAKISGTLSTAVLPASVPLMQGTTMTVNGALAVAGNITAGGSLTARGISIAAGATITGDGSGLTNLDAARISTGTLDAARLPPILATSITGTLGVGQLPSSVPQISGGTLAINGPFQAAGIIRTLDHFVGSGAELTNVPVQSLVGTIPSSQVSFTEMGGGTVFSQSDLYTLLLDIKERLSRLETHLQLPLEMDWLMDRVTTSGVTSSVIGEQTVLSMTGRLSQTGGGPAMQVGGSQVFTTTQFGTHFPFIALNTTTEVTLVKLVFTPLFPPGAVAAPYSYGVYLDKVNPPGSVQLGTNLTAQASGMPVTIALDGSSTWRIPMGQHTIYWRPVQPLPSGQADTGTDYFGLAAVTLYFYVE
jgi:hypothetical protein